jgi:8-oxo-dGTP pyrophosphatase MutT (NUDIX family)
LNPRVTPSGSVEAVEALIRSRLHGLEAYDRAEHRIRSDRDLSPEGWPTPHGPMQPAAVLIPLVEREQGLTVLLTRRAETLRRHSGQIAFPGGRADPGEPPWETALREAEEEVGLDRSFVRVAGLCDPYETVTGYSIVPVVGFVRTGFTLDLHAAEVAEVFEIPFAFAMDPANHERRTRDFGDGLSRGYFAIAHDERLVWGATAGMLRMFYERVFGD